MHGVYPGGIDTDMLAGIDAPKTPPAEVAAGLLDGLAADQEDIFPDPTSRAMSSTWGVRAASGAQAAEKDVLNDRIAACRVEALSSRVAAHDGDPHRVISTVARDVLGSGQQCAAETR